MMTLALLLTAATGAWATVYSGQVSRESLQVGDILVKGAEVTSETLGYGLSGGSYRQNGSILNGLLVIPGGLPVIGDDGLLTLGTTNFTPYDADNGRNGNAWKVVETGNELYGVILAGTTGPDPNAVPITWDEATMTATIASMPARNVEVNVNYFAQAELAMSTDATPVALAPAAIDGVKATTDEDIITAGTVADIANTTTKQGTLMYYASKTELTDAQLVALADADAFSAVVPKATDLTQGDVYVYYYIQGAEPTSGDHTDANTCSDSDIKALTVTLDAAPLWNAEFDLTDAPEEDKAPGVWTTDIPKGGVVKGTDVTVTYTGNRKVIGVKAEKKVPFAANEYNEASWDGEKVVLTRKTAASEPTALESADHNVTWNKGWYTVSGNVTITGKVLLGADTHLILQDGAQLTINGQLKCYDGDNAYNLYIYGQEAGDGKLNVSNNDVAIYGSVSIAKTIEIHGGEITATSTSGFGFYYDGIKFYGGKLTSTSGGMRGIMFGSGNFDVYGGEVEAICNGDGMAACGISNSSGYEILTVYGGKVKATGGTGNMSQAIYAKIKSGTSDIKFYFTNTEGDWGDGATYSPANNAPANRYAKAE